MEKVFHGILIQMHHFAQLKFLVHQKSKFKIKSKINDEKSGTHQHFNTSIEVFHSLSSIAMSNIFGPQILVLYFPNILTPVQRSLSAICVCLHRVFCNFSAYQSKHMYLNGVALGVNDGSSIGSIVY